MEAVQKQSLQELIRQRGALPLGQALTIIRALSHILSEAHQAGRSYGGFQPAEVLLGPGHKVLLGQPAPRLPPYLAPEEMAGGETGPWTDVYAVGVLAYELLAGRPPFSGSAEEVARQVAQGAPPIRSFRPGLPEGVQAVLQKALAWEPQARYTHAISFSRALERALVSQPAQPAPGPEPPPPQARQRKRLGLAVGLGVAALFLLAAAMVPILLPRQPTPLATPAYTGLPSYAPGRLQAVRLNLGGEPSSIDPALVTDDPGMNAAGNLFLGLTTFDPETAEVLPELATSWEASQGGQVWTFHLRADVYWVLYDTGTSAFWNIRPVTAQDVVYGVRRSVVPETGGTYAYPLYVIRNAERINRTRPPTETYDLESLGVRALDARTVQFTLEYPAGYFPAITALWAAWPQPGEAIEAHGSAWTEPGNILTNGAYGLQEWRHGSRMRLVKNPYHYRAGQVQIATVDYVMVTDPGDTLALYEGGQLDSSTVSMAPEPEPITDLRRRPALTGDLHVASVPCTYYYVFTTDKPPLDDVRVRRALSYAIDRQELVDNVAQGGEQPAHTLAPPGTFGSPAGDPEVGISFDPEKARQELAQAGYPGGRGFPSILLAYNPAGANRHIAEAVAQMWRETLAIPVKSRPWQKDLVIGPDTPVTVLPHAWPTGWCSDYPDEHNWVFELFNPSRGPVPFEAFYGIIHNEPRMRLSDPQVGNSVEEFDRLTWAAGRETDPARREAMYRQAEHLLVNEIAAIAPIYYYTQAYLTRPFLHRDYPPFGGIEVERWWIEPH